MKGRRGRFESLLGSVLKNLYHSFDGNNNLILKNFFNKNYPHVLFFLLSSRLQYDNLYHNKILIKRSFYLIFYLNKKMIFKISIVN